MGKWDRTCSLLDDRGQNSIAVARSLVHLGLSFPNKPSRQNLSVFLLSL